MHSLNMEVDSSSTRPSSYSVDVNATIPMKSESFSPILPGVRRLNGITRDECIAHLKLLECFHQLRERVSSEDGLFRINSHHTTESSKESTPESIREKRWAVYVARAVERFARWWDACVPRSYRGQYCGKLSCNSVDRKNHLEYVQQAHALGISKLGGLPPIGMFGWT